MARWVMPVMEGVAFVMESVTFIQFIQEESIQACGLAVFMAIRAKRYTEARLALDTLEGTLLYHLRLVNEAIGFLAPYSAGAFADFVTATETAISTYRSLLVAAP